MSAAGAGQAGRDGGCSSAARVAHEKRVLAIENNALHLALGYVLVDGHCAIRGEDVQFRHWPRAELIASANLGILYANGLDYAKTEERFKTGILRAPHLDQSYLNRACLYIIRTNKGDAREVLQELLRL
jgi:hypothetical protein